MAEAYDATVVGAGPNGLSAAIELARSGRSVLLLEAQDTIGGGARSFELTLPGFVHDFGSAIHPLGAGSPFFRALPLAAHGLEWIHPAAPLAHPLDDGTAVLLERSVAATASQLGSDADTYRRLMEPLVADWSKLEDIVLGPAGLPGHPLAAARFGVRALRSANGLAKRFRQERARALFAGMAAHSFLKLEQVPSAAFALLLGTLGHAIGWPFPRGGSGCIALALGSYLATLQGEIRTGVSVQRVDDVPPSGAILFDVAPRHLSRIAASRLPIGYRRMLERYRHGPGAFKLDYAIDGPIPWKAPECLRAGTVHLGGTFAEIAAAERTVSNGRHPEKPFVLLAQQSLFDQSRAPEGKHTVWAYCHVPNGSTVDMTERIERQIERFAPGFRDRILARHVSTPADLERADANLVGGDIGGGLQDLRQILVRPAPRTVPYATPARTIFICSASTPPGGGVHGMCGYHAARAVLRRTSRKAR